MTQSSAYRDPAVAAGLLDRIRDKAATFARPVTLMEVCGTHTMAIHEHGLRGLLPAGIRLVSGPGCPVCVTPIDYVDQALALCRLPDTIITTFGDMVRVPGSQTSLLEEKARGADIRIVYSALDAVSLARHNPDRQVVFLGVGFETTAPTVAGAILQAQQAGLDNFSVLCAHKTMPAPMQALSADPDLQVDGYLCPAHVSAIIGADAYTELTTRYRVPCVVTGFEPLDILQGVDMLVSQIVGGIARVENQYCRYVKNAGNPRAQQLLTQVFEPCDARWRGLGLITASGLQIRAAYSFFDAAQRFGVTVAPAAEPLGCRCGEILKGKLGPRDCPLFGQRCTPATPVGACMVSSEGTCAAEYKYGF
ncbi:hydrogenase formation protein HypD [Pelobacter seleniigenes]|uniref:hydrogenase formation protein HypD n=1 Tax=Pelobacter seleniigenes TaxID=407188 RepID=UPI0004A71942|nr:hydrogenase formation protein HypD [Pelobacter seleniigenes]